MGSTGRRLMFHGMVLFLLGLGTGFAEQHFANVRMGLAAHLEGLMNGIFLLALGRPGRKYDCLLAPARPYSGLRFMAPMATGS
jgi:hypothetical protein